MDAVTGERQPHQVVRIGVGQARIVRVTPEHLVYHDKDGSEYHLDLPQCSAHWARWHEEHAGDFVLLPGVDANESRAWNSRCVGERGACDDPPWVELRSEPPTRFEFESYEATYQELLGPLGKAGWHTFDTN
jgi:hypothetical protein